MSSLRSDVNSTLGALLISTIVSIFLFGIGTQQTCSYYVQYPNDRFMLKFLVAFVWVVEAAQSGCICYLAYYWMVIHYGEQVSLVDSPTVLVFIMLLSSIAFVNTQVFFLRRIRILSGGHPFVPVICGALSFTTMGLILWLSVILLLGRLSPFALKSRWQPLLIAILVLGAFIDITITSNLCFYFHRMQRKSIRSTNTAIKIARCKLLACETGCVTSIIRIALLICYLSMPTNFIWFAIFIVLPRFSSNSMLASLNGRDVPWSSHHSSNTDVDTPIAFIGRPFDTISQPLQPENAARSLE